MLKYYIGDLHVLDQENYMIKIDIDSEFTKERVLQEEA